MTIGCKRKGGDEGRQQGVTSSVFPFNLGKVAGNGFRNWLGSIQGLVCKGAIAAAEGRRAEKIENKVRASAITRKRGQTG